MPGFLFAHVLLHPGYTTLSTDSTSFEVTQPSRFSSNLRFLLLLLILITELLAVTIRFDTVSLDGNKALWAQLLAQSPAFSRLGLIFILAILVVGGPKMKVAAGHFREHMGRHQQWWIYLFFQVLAYGGFWLLTAVVVEGDLDRSRGALLWVILWHVIGAATAWCWVAAAAAPKFWGQFVRDWYPALIVSGVVGLCAWTVGQLSQHLWRPLGSLTFWAVERLLQGVYSDVVSRPAEQMVGTPTFNVEIAPECSGYEGIGLVCVILAAFLWSFRNQLRFPRVWLLLPLGVLAIWTANALRVAALIVVGTSLSPEVALGGFHSQTGSIAFCVVAMGIGGLALRSPFFFYS